MEGGQGLGVPQHPTAMLQRQEHQEGCEGDRAAGWDKGCCHVAGGEEKGAPRGPPPLALGGGQSLRLGEHRSPGRPLTELGPIQKFSCWMYLTLSYTPLFLSTCRARPGSHSRLRGGHILPRCHLLQGLSPALSPRSQSPPGRLTPALPSCIPHPSAGRSWCPLSTRLAPSAAHGVTFWGQPCHGAPTQEGTARQVALKLTNSVVTCWVKPMGAMPYVPMTSKVMRMCTKVIQ